MKYFKITELDSCKDFYISSCKPDETAEQIAKSLDFDPETYKVEEVPSEEFETAMEDVLQESFIWDRQDDLEEEVDYYD